MRRSSTLGKLVFLSAAAVAIATAQTATVFVPGNTLGSFGSPVVAPSEPYVVGIAVPGPGTIVIAYLSGTVTDGPVTTGPDGTPYYFASQQSPLQETVGIAGGTISNLDALIGNFAPLSRVQASGFSPVDGTKDIVRVGLLPSNLFFIGTGQTINVKEAGTLFLGINDDDGATNGGGYNVSLTFTAAS